MPLEGALAVVIGMSIAYLFSLAGMFFALFSYNRRRAEAEDEPEPTEFEEAD